jgi:hypothetical protein
MKILPCNIYIPVILSSQLFDGDGKVTLVRKAPGTQVSVLRKLDMDSEYLSKDLSAQVAQAGQSILDAIGLVSLWHRSQAQERELEQLRTRSARELKEVKGQLDLLIRLMVSIHV